MSELKRPIRYKRPCFYNHDDLISHAKHESRDEAIDECFAWFRQEIMKAYKPTSDYATVQNILKLKEQLD